MFRAAYDFQAPYENTLSFLENELFIELKRNNKDQVLSTVNESSLFNNFLLRNFYL